MNDQNQNMDDFIKRKLEDLSSTGDWDKPRPIVRDAVISQIAPDRPDRRRSAWWLWVLGLAILGSLGYIGVSLNQKKGLEHELRTYHTDLDNKNERINRLNEDLGHHQNRLDSERAASKKELDSLQYKLKQMNVFLQTQTSLYTQSNGEALRLKNRVSHWEVKYGELEMDYQEQNRYYQDKFADQQKKSISEITKANQISTLYDTDDLMLLLNSIPRLPLELMDIPKLNPVRKNIGRSINPIRKNRNKYRVGYDLTLQQVDLSTEKSFENQQLTSDGLQIQSAWDHSHGLYLAYSPIEGWWVRSGASHSSLSLQHRAKLGIGYNAEGEFSRPDASKGNVLLLNTETSFAGIESQIEIINPRGRELQTGDLIELSINEELDLNILRVPLGVEYLSGHDRLNWMGQLGVVWNRINYTRYNIQVDGVARVGGIPISRSEVSTTDIPNSEYVNLYGGIGLQYRVYSSWFIQPSLLYHYNFSKQISSTKTSAGLHVSLNYNF